MSINEFSTDDSFDQQVNLSREFKTGVLTVFKAWTDPQQLSSWWGPKNFTNPRCQIDPRTGGGIRIDMRAPDGTIYPMSGVFREVVPNERLVFTSSALDKKEQPIFEVLNTVTFVEQEDKTTLNLHVIVLKVMQPSNYLGGWSKVGKESLDRLEEFLELPPKLLS